MADTGADSEWGRLLGETVEGAAAVLSDAFGLRLGLHLEDNFREPKYRAIVLRCRVQDAGGGEPLPSSVIVKRFFGDQGEPYDPADVHPTGARARLLNEWTGVRFLEGLGGEHPFGPGLYGGNGRLGLVVLEDLGEGLCLADRLQGEDPEQAETALLAYATTLGRLHAATAGGQQRYAELHQELAGGGADPVGARMIQTWLAASLPRFRKACAALDLDVSEACDAELASLKALADHRGLFSAYSVGDTCPDNHRYIPDSPGYLRFYDMEFGGFQHALFDAAYLWMPFPTCWCVARLPQDLSPQLEAKYRAELARGCPEAADDVTFERAIAEACGVWFALTGGWSLIGVLERDEQWGISSVRQRFPLRADNFARVAERAHHLPALSALARRIAERLRVLWGEGAEMPLYRPFDRTGNSTVSSSPARD